MAKNRKIESAARRFSSALRVSITCLLIGGAGVGYVELQTRLHILGARCRELELRLNRLDRENAGRTRLLDTLQSPAELDAKAKEMNLGLVPPRPDQILRLAHKPQEQTRQNSDQLYADGNTRNLNQP